MPEEKHEQVVMEEEVSAQVAPEKEEVVIAEAEIVLEVASEKQEPVILEMPEEKHRTGCYGRGSISSGCT